MKRFFSLLIVSLLTLLTAACGGGGGSAGTPGGSASPSNFRVNAPAEATLAVGSKFTYSISGGLAPYLVTNSAPTVVSAVVVGATLEITPLRSGTAEITVAPTGGGASFTMTLTLASSANPLQVQAPDTVTLQAGNSGSYTILGGAPPYRAVSSAPSVVSASVVGSSLQVVASALGSATVAIYDSSSSAPVQRTFTVVSTTAFFSTAPSSVAMGNGTSRSFTVSGGVAPYYVASSNSAVADASLSGGNLTIVAGATNGTANIALRDSGGSTIAVAVTVGTNVAFFSNAPDTLTIQGGASRSFTLGGGTAPYSAASANTNVVVATVSGNSVTLVGQSKGTTTVSLKDALGASISLDVTVDQSSSLAVTAIELTSTLASIRSAGEEATITALVKGASNVGVPNADITFSSDSGILLSPSAQTDASGVATVKLGPGSNRVNRIIVVTARVGSLTQTINIAVVGTTVTVTGSSALQVGGAASQYNARVLDSAGNPISGLALTPTSVTLGNGVTPASTSTDLFGNATFSYTPTNAGADILRVRSSSGGVNTDGQLSISISPVSFDYVSPTPAASTQFGVNQGAVCDPGVLPPQPPNCRPQFRVRLLINGVATAGRTVSFTTTRGALSASSVATDAAGEAVVNLTSNSAGAALVTAQVDRQATDPGTGTTLGTVSRIVNFTGVLPNNVRIQANPTSIPPNTGGSSTNRAEVVATVVDASANPVAGRQVSFNITADPSNGSLSAGLATTDSSGVARVEYISGPNSSPTDGVSIQATVAPVNGDIPASLVTNGVAPNSQPAKLTVNGNALFITISFGNTITNVDPSTYSKPFSVYVTDASGLAVPNQTVTLSAIPTRYRKGELYWGTTIWKTNADPGAPAPTPPVPLGCPNEDTNLNGILNAGEDTNGNGTLTPGNVAVAAPGTVTTNSSGLASFDLIYGEQFAFWVDVDIVASATVAGTESKRAQPFSLSPLSSDVSDETNPPSSVRSPFGTTTVTCANPN
ncbi:MAG: Ig-like domain-containing protein [Burkholderiaceae bacterium]